MVFKAKIFRQQECDKARFRNRVIHSFRDFRHGALKVTPGFETARYSVKNIICNPKARKALLAEDDA